MFYSVLLKALRWINLLLATGLLLCIFYLIRVMLLPAGVKFDTKIQQNKTSAQRIYSIDNYAGLLKENPFGIKGEFRLLTKSEGSQNDNAITLIGTVSGGDHNYAIVADSTGKQEIFKKGQDVYGIGRLRAVYKDKIIIKTPSGDKVYEIADVIIREVRGQRPEVRKDSEFRAPAGVGRLSQNVFTINSEALRQAIENPREILTDARFVPNIVDGRQEGFIVRELKKGGVYESLGLEDGDILLRVNDFPITGPESALQAFTALKGMDRIELDIMRKGQRISMTYQIR
ncbi:MAG: type II secretion system protein N [Thermodesulfovibrionales bacterium]